MIFNSVSFILFLAFFFTVYGLLKGRPRLYFLLGSSYFFYGWWNVTYLSLIVLSTAIDYFLALFIENALENRKRKVLVGASVLANLLLLCVFKYFNFFADSFVSMCSKIGWSIDAPTLQVILPVGISFYTFQSISYIVDVYRRQISAEKDFVLYAAFVSFFPQLVAGPIERARHLLPQLRKLSLPTIQQFRDGLVLIIWGYFLKVFIADNVARIADHYFYIKYYEPYILPKFTGIEIATGLLAFTLQIYGDFAGYSSIARGVAKWLGVDLILNFRQPYFACNPSDFWQRWHISLSTWLRDYLYIPLGGNKKGNLILFRNLLVTMFLAGLWHGAAWTFIIWGLFHGIILLGYHLYARFIPRFKMPESFTLVVSIAAMFIFTLGGWLIFRSKSLVDLQHYLSMIISNWQIPDGARSDDLILNIIWLGIFWLFVFVLDLSLEIKKSEFIFLLNRWWHYLIAAGMIFLTLFLGGKSEAFIYFRF